MRFLGVLLLFVGMAAFAQKKETASSPVLFTVKQPEIVKKGADKKALASRKMAKKPVTTDEFIYLYKKNHTQKSDFSEAKEDEYLTLLINFKLKIAEAHLRGMDTTVAFHKEFSTYKEELKRPYQAGNDDIDRLTKEAYEHLKEEVKASHLLITVKPDALPSDTASAYAKISALRQRAVAGEDFEKLAKEYSEDPSAKSNGGNLGYFTGFQMVYPFEKAAFETPAGGISPIVRTRFGYHIIKVFDRIPSRGEVEVSHILLRTNGTASDAKVKNTIFEIYDQLKAKRPWDDLVREYSEDPNTKNAGGKLKPFGPNAYASVPEFEKTAFAMKNPGDVSDPFQSKVGWHIIRLEKKIPLLPYKDTEAALKRKVSRDERLQISKSSSLAKKKKELGFTEDKNKVASLLTYKDSSVLTGKWNYPLYRSSTYPEPLAGEELFSVGGKRFLMSDFYAFVNANPSPKPVAPLSYLSQLYNKYTEQKISDAEEAKIIAEHPEYSLLLKEYEEGILLFEIMEKEVWNKASDDTTGQRIYYKTHLEKFKAGDRLEARIFSTTDKAFFDQIRSKIAKGDSITASDIKKFKSVQNKRSWEHGESKIVDKVSWVPGVQEAEADGNYYLVDVSRLVAPGTKGFEEARATVISDYQDELEKKWLVELRSKYPVEVNKKAKKAVIAELNK